MEKPAPGFHLPNEDALAGGLSVVVSLPAAGQWVRRSARHLVRGPSDETHSGPTFRSTSPP